MTKEQMQKLQTGDIVADLESTQKRGRVVLCEVTEKEEAGNAIEITIEALREEDKAGYPHLFTSGIDGHKIGKIIINGASEYVAVENRKKSMKKKRRPNNWSPERNMKELFLA